MKFKYLLLFNLINLTLCFSKFDDDDDFLNEFNHFPDPHLDIQRNKIKLPTSNLNDHPKLNSESFNFSNEDFKYDPFRGDKFNKNEPFKEDKYNKKNEPFKTNQFKDDYYFMKNDRFKDDEFKNDDQFKLNNNHQIIKTELPKTDNFKTKIILKKKEPKQYDTFNKSDSFVNEFNTDFDLNRIPDFDFNAHDSWYDQNRDFDIPRNDRINVDEKLVHDYRRPTPRTPFRVPMIPVPAFYPHPFPVLPTPFIPTFPANRPQQQQQQQQQQNRPQRPNNQQQQNSIQNQPGVFYPFYPVVMPHSIPNSQSNSQSSNSQNNINQQIQHALSNMMNRNSFLGFVDPLIIVAIIAIPVIAMLGFSSVIMPFIPVIIYILNIFFPVSAAGRKRRKRSTVEFDKFCLLFNLIEKNNFKKINLDKTKNIPIFHLSKFNELEIEILRRLHRSICMFNN